jgi:hypothetical protein
MKATVVRWATMPFAMLLLLCTRANAERDDEPVSRAVSTLAIELSGWTQIDAVAWSADSRDEFDPTTGAPLNQERLVVRRARLRAIGRGATMTAATPSDACMRFGPDIGNAEYRPRDPDITSGYYQPIRLTLPAQFGEAIAFASHRIGCGLANAPIDVVREFRNRYVANSNPPAPMLARADGGPADQARVGEQVELIASWPQDAAEPYLGFDAASAQLRDRRESLRVSWYASAGRFCSDATGAPEPEPGQTPEADTGNCWEAPVEPGPVAMWLVLRDSRGGAAVREVSWEILP